MYCSEPSLAFLQPRLDIPELTNSLAMAHVEVATEGSDCSIRSPNRRNAIHEYQSWKSVTRDEGVYRRSWRERSYGLQSSQYSVTAD